MATRSATIACGTHGRRNAAVVCGHLSSSSTELCRGLVENSAEPGDLQAWCDACEAFYLREDGRTEAFKEFHDMKVVCEACYEAIRLRHARLKPTT